MKRHIQTLFLAILAILSGCVIIKPGNIEKNKKKPEVRVETKKANDGTNMRILFGDSLPISSLPHRLAVLHGKDIPNFYIVRDDVFGESLFYEDNKNLVIKEVAYLPLWLNGKEDILEETVIYEANKNLLYFFATQQTDKGEICVRRIYSIKNEEVTPIEQKQISNNEYKKIKRQLLF